MNITIEKLHASDAEKLFEFELENRPFFEEMVPGRGEDYYHFETFKDRHKALLDEQDQGISQFYLIKNDQGVILGRMNLIDLDKSKSSAHIGYRVGKAYTGQGIANRALKLLMEIIQKQDIKQIEAKTTNHNIASQKVLEKNGFTCISADEHEFEMNGQQLRFVHYLWSEA